MTIFGNREFPQILLQILSFTCWERAHFRKRQKVANNRPFCLLRCRVWRKTRANRTDTVWMDVRALRASTLLALIVLAVGSDPNYDHQTGTYQAKYKGTYCRLLCTATPFFSPDLSIQTYVSLIQSAETSIDLLTPGTRNLWYFVSRMQRCYLVN